MLQKVIYTCLTGGYDTLLQPSIIDNQFDYICFSNDIIEKQIGVWQIRKITFESNDNSRLSRYPKILPHKVLPEYEYSIYMDANIQIIGNEFYDIINEIINKNELIAQVPHPFKKCIYEDIKGAYTYRRVDFHSAYKQFHHLKQEKFPINYGLYENNLILRKHNENKVIEISERWWNEYTSYSKRDQFSLMYVYWKQNFMPINFFPNSACCRNVNFLRFIENHSKENKPTLCGKIIRKIITLFFF